MEKIVANKYTINHIYIYIKDLSSKEFLIKTWLENSIPNVIFSYVELMCSLFDDFSFDLFIDIEVVKLGFGNELIHELGLLRGMLNQYGKKIPNNKWMDDKILKDPEFDKVIEQAGKVIKLWEEDTVAKEYINIE